jgi:hypothetical protein
MKCNYTGKTFRIYVRHSIEHFNGVKDSMIIVIRHIRNLPDKNKFLITNVDFGKTKYYY